MATGTSGEERDDDATNQVDDALDSTEIDPAEDAVLPAGDADAVEADADLTEEVDAAEGPAETVEKTEDVLIATAGDKPAKKTSAKGASKAVVEKPMNQKPKKPKREGLFARMGRFFREVRDELKKVVTPTRKELVKYTGVVLSFLVVMMLLVAALDFIFGFGSSWVFGNGTDLFPADTPAATSTVDPAATDPAATDPAATPDATVAPDATTVPQTTTP